MKNISLDTIIKPLKQIFVRFHMTIFIVFVVAGLAAAVILLNTLLTASSTSDGYTSPIDAGSVDQATLERIKELHSSSEMPANPALPSGRINPFGE